MVPIQMRTHIDLGRFQHTCLFIKGLKDTIHNVQELIVFHKGRKVFSCSTFDFEIIIITNNFVKHN